MLKFTRAIVQNAKCNNLNSYVRACFTTAPTPEIKTSGTEGAPVINTPRNKKQNNIVASAFASLKKESTISISTPHTDNRILSATSVEELLSISDGSGVSRKHALKVVSVLAEWSSNGKVNLPEFESDPRFLKLCKVLTRTGPKGNNGQFNTLATNRSEDISTILGITADDEAARLVASITVPQMVKVMSSLTLKKRRSMMLLRALAFNITKSKDNLELKQCGDLLYGMAVLHFPDENLLEKICIDICKGIDDDLARSSLIGSILTSFGLLKYKDTNALDTCCSWMLKHSNGCRPQDVFALFLTLAVLRHEPANLDQLFEVLAKPLTPMDAIKSAVWLDQVWSLVLLNKASVDHISSVLNEEFIVKLKVEGSLSFANKLKLINIDSTAEQLVKSYTGPRLPQNGDIRSLEITRTREKEDMCASIVDSLKNLVSEKCFKTKVDTGMGFYIDIECILDKKCTPVPLETSLTPEHKRVAILVLPYQDMCKGTNEPTGLTVLGIKLLESRGYRVISIPYTEYRPRDKLVDRVKYLEAKLKAISQ